MNFYKHFIGDYQRDTMHLTMQQDGAYRRLLDACYATERCLPKEKETCYRLARAFNKEERDAVDFILDQFFPVGEDGLRYNKRAIREVGAARLLSEKARQASLSRESYGSVRSQRISEARTRGRHSDAEWNALLDFCGNSCVKCGSTGPVAKDHIIPICNGGSDSIQNLQPLCDSCNSSKGPDPTDHRKQGWINSVREACGVSNDTANAVESNNDRSSDDTSSHSHSHSHTPQPKPDYQSQTKVKNNASPNGAAIPDWIPAEAWSAFVEMRKKIKAPLTEEGARLAIKRLSKFKNTGQNVREIIEYSIENSYRGLFQPRGRAAGSAGGNRQAADAWLAHHAKPTE